jgi:hypothetical protein
LPEKEVTTMPATAKILGATAAILLTSGILGGCIAALTEEASESNDVTEADPPVPERAKHFEWAQCKGDDGSKGRVSFTASRGRVTGIEGSIVGKVDGRLTAATFQVGIDVGKLDTNYVEVVPAFDSSAISPTIDEYSRLGEARYPFVSAKLARTSRSDGFSITYKLEDQTKRLVVRGCKYRNSKVLDSLTTQVPSE